MKKTKVCRNCGERKRIVDFYVVRSSKDGRDTWCSACRLEKSREYRSLHWERIKRCNRKNWKAWYERMKADPVMKERFFDRIKKYKTKERKAAWYAAKKIKAIENPKVCVCCGKKGSVEGHHRAYEHKDEVAWLCRSCHTKQHEDTHNKGRNNSNAWNPIRQQLQRACNSN